MGSHEQSHDHDHHIIGYGTHLVIYFGLLLLTGLTVAVARVNLGELNLWVAMLVATFKAALVILYFMHMKYEHKLIQFLFVIALLALFLPYGAVFIDYLHR
ncbi:MAG: cytochrome C oxidase subunit IV family protein [Candidatus Cloacimonetes bacterium]|nr:cytochrome C oxidase subunit IV family protein [Candidatus Cloacimonadota bacterium]